MKWFLKLVIIITMLIVIFLDLFYAILIIIPRVIYIISEKMVDFTHNLEENL